MGSLGYTMQMPEEERYLMTKDEITEEIVTLLAGRAAEELIFNTVTTGAANDIERATELARAMVTRLGMSDEFDMMALEKESNRYLNGNTVMTCSDNTGKQSGRRNPKHNKSCHKKGRRYIKRKIQRNCIE